MSDLGSDSVRTPLERFHGTGNDFAIVEAEAAVGARRHFARSICDPTGGLAVDGVLFLGLEPTCRPPRVVMTLVQPDGSTAPMCGNGARCAAAWAMDRTGTDVVMIDTQAGSRRATRVSTDEDADWGIAVEMGPPSFDPESVPVRAAMPVVDSPLTERTDGVGFDERTVRIATDAVNRRTDDLRVTAVDTGVPHAVAFVDDVDAVALDRLGPAIRNAEPFPLGANVTIASRIDERTVTSSPNWDGPAEERPTAFHQRTYERGVEGETAACGTGAVAIAAVARRLGAVDAGDRLTIRPPGGELNVSFDECGRAILEGPVVRERTLTVAVTGETITVDDGDAIAADD